MYFIQVEYNWYIVKNTTPIITKLYIDKRCRYKIRWANIPTYFLPAVVTKYKIVHLQLFKLPSFHSINLIGV